VFLEDLQLVRSIYSVLYTYHIHVVALFTLFIKHFSIFKERTKCFLKFNKLIVLEKNIKNINFQNKKGKVSKQP